MKPKTYWTLGVLVVLLICASVFLFEKYIDPEHDLLKKPPPGETYTTGHWEGDEWRRTVPPDPEKILIDGVWKTYEDMEKRDSSLVRSSERDVYRKHAIENYPYSELALNGRLDRAERDENNKWIWDKEILVPRYKAMLKWHSDSPRLLKKLAALLEEDTPAEAIKYGEEALKYTHLYPANTYNGYMVYPEDIHSTLGIAYQRVGDYKSALRHLKAAVKLMEANPDRAFWNNVDTYKEHIKRIKAGNPLYGPAYLDPDYLKR